MRRARLKCLRNFEYNLALNLGLAPLDAMGNTSQRAWHRARYVDVRDGADHL